MNANSPFDAVVPEPVSNRLRSDLSWYGKVEIGANGEMNIQILLYFPTPSSPPGVAFVFKRDPSSNDLVLAQNFGGGTKVEEKGDDLAVYYGNFPNPYPFPRLTQLDKRLGETLLVSNYRKKLVLGLSAQEPDAIRWAYRHGLPVWREITNFNGSHWEKIILPYVPFEYEEPAISEG